MNGKRVTISSDETSIFWIKDGKGNILETHNVPKAEEDEFTRKINSQKQMLCSSYGCETVQLIKVSKCF